MSKKSSSNSFEKSENVLPTSFVHRKRQILTALETPIADYNDKSPKGSVDEPIRDLIKQINDVDGWVTTSSCSGRVAVFVEGFKGSANRSEVTSVNQNEAPDAYETVENHSDGAGMSKRQVPAGPGGKGHGNRWLFVSHEPLQILDSKEPATSEAKPTTSGDSGGRGTAPKKHKFTETFGLQSSESAAQDPVLSQRSSADQNLRLIRLIFSPLILHVLCASLKHARHLLAAAINAGFRESGVQSLKALEDPDAGVMVAIRTAGIGFETVIGIVTSSTSEDGRREELMKPIVGENYLQMCTQVVNERFGWNDARRERLREELNKYIEISLKENAWEDKRDRQQRKRKEGLQKSKELHERQAPVETKTDDVLTDGICLGYD